MNSVKETMKKLLLALVLALGLATQTQATTRTELPGCWYTDIRLDGQYACLVRDSHIQSSQGRIELPTFQQDGRTVKDNVLMLRLPPVGEFAIAGQSHNGLGNWEYRGGVWKVVGASYGVNPVLYDWQPTLHVGAPQFGSQGLRYATQQNQLVTGDATYADPSKAIWEWTEYGDVRVGQGAGGCIAIHGALRYMLEQGDCRFVRYTRSADNLAIAMVKQLENKAVTLRLTVAELSTFPPETAPPVDPPVDPPIDPPQPVECGMVPAAGQLAIRALYARPEIQSLVKSSDDEDRRKATRIFAEQMAFTVDPKWGTKRADPNRPPSKDAISRFVLTTLCNWDIVNGTTRELQFGHGEPIPGQVFIPVTPTNHLGTTPNPEPEPEPEPDPEIAKLKARILVLEGQLLEANEALTAVTAQRDALQRELDQLNNQPPPTCIVKVSGPSWVRSLFGISATCEVVK
jgi:hypothetical protein